MAVSMQSYRYFKCLQRRFNDTQNLEQHVKSVNNSCLQVTEEMKVFSALYFVLLSTFSKVEISYFYNEEK